MVGEARGPRLTGFWDLGVSAVLVVRGTGTSHNKSAMNRTTTNRRGRKLESLRYKEASGQKERAMNRTTTNRGSRVRRNTQAKTLAPTEDQLHVCTPAGMHVCCCAGVMLCTWE